MAVVRWTFFNPLTATTFTFPLNPNQASGPTHKKTITQQATAAPNGRTLLFEGQDEVQRITFKGVVFSTAQRDVLEAWWALRHQFQLTNDLLESYWVYGETFTPNRVRSALFPGKHEYDFEVIVLDVPA